MKGEPEGKVNHACQMSTCEDNPVSEWLFQIRMPGWGSEGAGEKTKLFLRCCWSHVEGQSSLKAWGIDPVTFPNHELPLSHVAHLGKRDSPLFHTVLWRSVV